MSTITKGFAKVETADGLCIRTGNQWVVLAEFWVELHEDEGGQLIEVRSSQGKVPHWALQQVNSPADWPPPAVMTTLESVSQEEVIFFQGLLQEAKSAECNPTKATTSLLNRSQQQMFLTPRTLWSWLWSFFRL